MLYTQMMIIVVMQEIKKISEKGDKCSVDLENMHSVKSRRVRSLININCFQGVFVHFTYK